VQEAPVAQRIEQLTSNQQVRGSSPLGCASYTAGFQGKINFKSAVFVAILWRAPQIVLLKTINITISFFLTIFPPYTPVT
jgi:hypothetical protein